MCKPDTGQIHWLHFPANLNVMDGAANIRVDRAEAGIYSAASTLNEKLKIKTPTSPHLNSQSQFLPPSEMHM